MNEFDARLHECLEALIEGRWDLDACLGQYPEHAAELRPLLLAAMATAQAYAGPGAEPRAEFAMAARERFLIATGQRLQETMDVEPEPGFFAGARVRFLMRAQKMRAGQAANTSPRRAIPLFGTPFRALGGAMAAVVIFLGFSTYTVATASAALPGDWQYGVKLQTERVRLALAFSDTRERAIKLDIAAERINEIEELSNRGKIIGPGVLDRLVEHTKPLVDDVQGGDWATSDAARLQDIARKQKQVLQEAQADAHIASDALPELAAAEAVSQDGVQATTQVLFADPSRLPVVVTPEIPLNAPATSTPDIILAPPSATPTAASTPDPGATAENTPPVPTAVVIPSDGDDVTIGAQPVAVRGGISYYELHVGRVRLLVPGADGGWYLDGNQDAVTPTLLRYQRVDGTAFIVISKLTGDMYWFVKHNETYDEVQLRVTRNGVVFVGDRDVIAGAYGDLADVPLYVLDSITLLPEPTPVPEPTNTPVSSPTSTAP